MVRFRICYALLISLLAAAQSPNAAAPTAQPSTITVHVFKSGLFSGFAHNHVVVAPVSHAAIDPAHLTAEIMVVAKEMKVTDPGVSDKDRAEIQSTMLGPKVLDQEKYPEIRFKSSHIELASPQHYRVAGTLELHGVKRDISFEVIAETEPGPPAPTGMPRGAGVEHYHGSAKFKQSEFGIQPISLFGGSVKVKDQLELEFDVHVPAAAPAPAPAKHGR